jgi:hypothetical protein
MPFPFPFTMFGASRASNVPAGCEFTYCYGGDWVQGKLGNYGMNFDGVDDSVIANTLATQMQSANTFSVSFWASGSSYSTYPSAFALSNASDASKAFIIFPYGNTGGDGVKIWYNNATIIDENTATRTGWNHFAFVSNEATNHVLYVNGTIIGISTTSKTLDSGLNTFTMGGSTNFSQYFVGAIDEVAVWDVPLTPAQISLLSTGSARADSFTPPAGDAVNGDWSTGTYKKIGTYGVGQFDGSTNYISASWDSEIDFDNADDFSWSLWIYPTSFDSYNWIMAKESAVYTGGYYCSLYGLGVGKVVWGSYATGNPQNISTTALILDSWNHVVVTKGTGTNYLAYKIYINGAASGMTNNGGNNTGDPSGYPLTLGRREAGTYPFDGYMDDIAIFNTELTSGDVLELYNSGSALTGALASGVRTSALKAYWDCENPGPGSTTISGSRGLDATMMGGMDGGTAASTGSLLLYYDFEIGDSNPVSGNFPANDLVYDVTTASFHPSTAHNGTMNASMDVADFGAWGQGKLGKYCLDFDGGATTAGTHDYVFVPSGSSLPIGAGGGNFTFAAWCYQTTDLAWRPAIYRGDADDGWDNQIALGKTTAGSMGFYVGDWSTPSEATFTEINTWAHFVGVYDSSTPLVSIYKNGVLIDSATPTNLNNPSIGDLYLGAMSGTTANPEYPWKGSLDEIAIYNVAIDSGAISNLYNSGQGAKANTVSSSALVVYYDMECSGPGSTNLKDLSGNDLSGTLTNMSPGTCGSG